MTRASGRAMHGQRTMRPLLLFIATLAIAGWGHAPATKAQASPPLGQEGSDTEQASEASAYDAAVSTAVREFDLGNYAEARAQFARARAVHDNAQVLRGLGMCEFELKNYRASIDFLRQSLAHEELALDGDVRRAAQELLRTALGYVAHFDVQLRPGQAQILIDGQRIQAAEESLVLTVGEYQLEVRAPGHETVRRKLKVVGGEREPLRIELVPLADEPRVNTTPAYKKWWLWTAVGAVVAGGATALAVSLAGRERVASPTPSELEGVGVVELTLTTSSP